MAIPETQLETWSHQGSITQSAQTYADVRKVLEDSRAPYASKDFSVFLSGSYGNDTNIFADSDVDIIICLNSTYYSETDNLSESEKSNYQNNWSAASYGIEDFRKEVLRWLEHNYGGAVKDGNKAIAIKGNSKRRDADVLPCAQHRRYTSYSKSTYGSYHQGIIFWTKDGKKIINFPKQHKDNCSQKHNGTNNRFKPHVRIVKNMRNELIGRGKLNDGVAPSYFLEGMLWNAPNSKFVYSRGETFINYWNWLNESTSKDLVCANDLHWLIRDGAEVCWNESDFRTTLDKLAWLWNNY